MRKILLVVLTLSLMLGFGVMAVAAQDDTGDETPTTPIWPGGMRGAFGGNLANAASQIALIAEALGMDEADLLAALQEGQTLTEIAEAQGVELDTINETFIAARQAAFEEQLAAAVEAGDITQEEADAMLVLHAARQEEFAAGEFAFGNMFGGRGMFGGNGLPGGRGMMGNWGQRGQLQGQRGGMWGLGQNGMFNGPFNGPMAGSRGFGFAFGSQNMIDVTAEALGMDTAELTEALQAGQTLAEIAEEQGVEPAALIAAHTAAFVEQVTAAVEDGQLTEEQAATLIEQHSARVGAMLSGDFAPGNLFGGGMRGGLRGGGMFGGRGPGGMWNQG